MTVQQSKSNGKSAAATYPARQGFFPANAMPRILPFAAYMAFIAIADLLHWAGLTAQQLLWLYPVKAAVVFGLLLWYWRHYVELVNVRPSLRDASIAVVSGVLVFILWINLNASWMQVGAPGGFEPVRAGGGTDWLLVAIRLAGAALIVPVMEELFWRSFLQRWLAEADFLACKPAVVGLRALLIASVLFGFEHNLWFAGIVAGLAYGFLYLRTGNLWVPIIAHAVTNGLLGGWVLVTASWTYW